jgi:CHAT domain-containing protein
LAGLLSELRAVTEDGSAAARVRLENAVRDRARQAPGSAEPAAELWSGHLSDALGEKALVCYLRRADRLLAISLVDGRHRVHDVGAWAGVGTELDWLRFATHQLWRDAGAGETHDAAREALGHSTGLLDRTLLQGLRELTDRPLVLIPTAELHAVPWAMLPAAAGRAIEVAPSIRLWWSATRSRRARPGPVLLAAGPGLAHAGREISAVARLHPGARVLRGSTATVDAVLAGLNGAALAHLACHGRFRADQPQFSQLTLADGPLTVHDLSRLPRAPRVVVLSACEAARCASVPGDELLGLAAALLALGTRTLIAPVTSVPDRATAVLMVALHRRLRAGDTPAAALAAASAAVDVPGFVCLGAG